MCASNLEEIAGGFPNYVLGSGLMGASIGLAYAVLYLGSVPWHVLSALYALVDPSWDGDCDIPPLPGVRCCTPNKATSRRRTELSLSDGWKSLVNSPGII